MKIAIAILAVLALSACTSPSLLKTSAPLVSTNAPIVSIDAAPPPIVTANAIVVGCPVVHDFTPDQNKALALALPALPAGSIWHDVAKDDQEMRAQARACNAANKTK